MNPKHPYSAVAVCCVVFFAFVSSLCAQQTIPLRHVGDPEDWSTNQIVFSRDAVAKHPGLIDREPRIRHRLVQHWQPSHGSAVQRAITNLPIPSGLKRDWNITTLGARLRENAFPAKYTFDPSAPPDCVKDYVVFGLSTIGADGGQANLVAFNNLYVNDAGTGYCPGMAPNVMFAYNVSTAGGKIDTSPVLSLDGTEIAFVETVAGNPGSAIFHVLTWQPNQGAIGTAFTPPSTQMSSLLVSTTPNTTSSPWVDYSSDTAYIGDAKGNVFQITPVFNGTPNLSGNPGWPVNVSTPFGLTSPILDSVLDVLMVGSANGNIYQIPISAPGSFTTASIGNGTSPQIVAPTIVDITNGTTFVVASDNGSSAVLEQFQTANILAPPVIGTLGLGASGGTKMHLYQPAFSNAYYNYSGGTSTNNGVVSLCGTGAADTSPYQYTFNFTGATMNTPAVSSNQLSTGNKHGAPGSGSTSPP